MSKFIFSSPRKYVQGSGVLDELGDYLPDLGGKSFLIADDVVWGIIGDRVQKSLKKAGVEFHYEPGEEWGRRLPGVLPVGHS